MAESKKTIDIRGLFSPLFGKNASVQSRHDLRWIDGAANFLVKYGLLSLVIFLPFSIAGVQIAAGVVLFGTVILTIRKKQRLDLGGLGKPLFFYLFAISISIFFANAHHASSSESVVLYRWLALPGLLFALRYCRIPMRTILVLLACSTVLSACYAIMQHFVGMDWIRPSGRALHLAKQFTLERYRPTGTFHSVSTLAFVLSMGACYLVSGVLESKRRLLPRVLLLASSILVLAAVGFTGVRAAWMGLAGSFWIATALRGKKAFLLTVSLSALVGFSAVTASPAIREKSERFLDLDFESNRARAFMWIKGLEMIDDNPISGIGFTKFPSATHDYYDDYQREDSPWIARCHLHNNFLHTWATTGPLGLFAFLWMFTVFFGRRGAGSTNPYDRTMKRGSFLAVWVFLIGSLTQDPLFDAPIFYHLLLAFAVGLYRSDERKSALQPALGGIVSRVLRDDGYQAVVLSALLCLVSYASVLFILSPHLPFTHDIRGTGLWGALALLSVVTAIRFGLIRLDLLPISVGARKRRDDLGGSEA